MKLLFTADVHAPADDGPYRLLTLFAKENDCALAAVAGDLLDLFSEYPCTQAHTVTGWLRAPAPSAKARRRATVRWRRYARTSREN